MSPEQTQERLPPWGEMDKEDRETLMERIILLIAQCREIPRQMLQPLPTPLLNRLLLAVRQLKNEGLLGREHRIPDRLKRLKELLLSRGLGEPKAPSENEVLAQQPMSVQRETRANESLNLREANARQMMEMQSRLMGSF